jgi:hypothetical protein
VKGKTRIEIEGEILADVEKEMQKPRLTESVRNGLSAQAAQDAKKATRMLSRSTALKRRQAGKSLVFGSDCCGIEAGKAPGSPHDRHCGSLQWAGDYPT